MTRKPKLVVYTRADGKWDWRLVAGNGQIVATSGGQGYERPGRAREMGERVVSGAFMFDAGALLPRR